MFPARYLLVFLFMIVSKDKTTVQSAPAAPFDNLNGTAWSKMADCFRQKLGPGSIHEQGVRCAGREMIAVYDEMDRMACKNCQLYFDCQANYNAVLKCDDKERAQEAAKAIEDCRKNKGYEVDIAAGEHGRATKYCEDRYLCSANCNYHPESKTCSRTNCRRSIGGPKS